MVNIYSQGNSLERKSLWWFLLLMGLAFCVYLPGLDVRGFEYRDDELFYVQSTQEMLSQKNFFSPTYFGENRFQKPILFYWLILLSYKIFGMNWFAARFVSVCFAGATAGLTWILAKQLFNQRVATLSALILMSSPLFFRHAKNAVPDMALNFFIVLSMVYAYQFFQEPDKKKYRILFFVSCGLGFMVKGIACVAIPMVTVIVFSYLIKKVHLLKKLNFLQGIGILVVIILPWFLFMISWHGKEYVDYMLGVETKDRIFGSGDNVIWQRAKQFFDHALIYMRYVFAYFIPWGLFLLGAFPLAFGKIFSKKSETREREAFQFLLTWTLVVFCIFSFMYFVISHYMLVLMTPVAILLSYFLLFQGEKETVVNRSVSFLKKYSLIFIFAVAYFAYCFILLFLMKVNSYWLILFIPLFICGLVILSKHQYSQLRPFLVGGFLLFIFSQSTLATKAGFTSHVTLEKFAETIIVGRADNYIVGVGSHDIHEMEFQVFFDQKIEKIPLRDFSVMQKMVYDLFDNENEVYCLLTEEDYNKYFKKEPLASVKILQEEYLPRKRMYIDKGFFLGILRLDRQRVYDYLMEKVLLVKKNAVS